MATAVSDPVKVKVRLMDSGRTLFARLGYEQASTAAIARDAQTSESQLMRHYGGKAGLLDAIFNEIWRTVNERVRQQAADATTAREALLAIASGYAKLLDEDAEIAALMLLEGWRIRGEGVHITEGYREFLDLLRRLFRRGRKDGSLASTLPEPVQLAALFGALEGLARERLIAARAGQPPPFGPDEVGRAFGLLLDAGALSAHPAA